MRTDTLAVVFTDIKGYTATTSSQSHRENAMLLKRVERLIAPVVKSYNGRVVKSIGDAYMIVFRSPTLAAHCAAAIQDRLHLHNTQVPSERGIHIRIAMNIGEVRVQKGDVFGEPVNIAARIESVTPADEIYISEAIYLTMNRTDLPAEKVGDYDLKGIPEPVTVYRVKKFAHLAADADPAQLEGDKRKGARLPFGGTQLEHWRRVRWVRRAYNAMWMIGLIGLIGAAYLRYRPTADYTNVLNQVAKAVTEGKPIDALALAGKIPASAVQERTLVRRHRRDAVKQLIEMGGGNLDPAEAELDALLHEDDRDAEALLLTGLLLDKRGDSGSSAMEAFGRALELHPDLSQRPDVINGIINGYKHPGARSQADVLVEKYVSDKAVPALIAALTDEKADRVAQKWLAARLEKLGAAEEVDWVALSIADLKSTSCKTRLAAIARLNEEGDERAIGALMKHAESKRCGAPEAKKAAQAILRR